MPQRPDPTTASTPRWQLVLLIGTALLAVFGGAVFAGDSDEDSLSALTGPPTPPISPFTGPVSVGAPTNGGLEVVEFGWSTAGDELFWGAIVANTSSTVLSWAMVSFGSDGSEREDSMQVPPLYPGERTAVGNHLENGDRFDLEEPEVVVTEPSWILPGVPVTPVAVTISDITAGWADPGDGDAYWTSEELTADPADGDRAVVRFRADSQYSTTWHPTAAAVFRDTDGAILGAIPTDTDGIAVPTGWSTHALTVPIPDGTELDTVEVHIGRPKLF